jgi:hypothetical protein
MFSTKFFSIDSEQGLPRHESLTSIHHISSLIRGREPADQARDSPAPKALGLVSFLNQLCFKMVSSCHAYQNCF